MESLVVKRKYMRIAVISMALVSAAFPRVERIYGAADGLYTSDLPIRGASDGKETFAVGIKPSGPGRWTRIGFGVGPSWVILDLSHRGFYFQGKLERLWVILEIVVLSGLLSLFLVLRERAR